MQNAIFKAILAALLLSPLMGASQSQTMPANQVSAPQIAFTFDDLPAHGPLPANETRLQVISRIVSALHDAGLPPIYGFVNGQGTVSEPVDIAALQAWHQAGNPLGNHTWSHMNLNQHTLEEFEADSSQNEALLASLMGTKMKTGTGSAFLFSPRVTLRRRRSASVLFWGSTDTKSPA